jgi:hypothetical protein
MFLFIASCGCVSMSPMMVEKNQSQFIDEILASQTYYDNLVKDESLNSTAHGVCREITIITRSASTIKR